MDLDTDESAESFDFEDEEFDFEEPDGDDTEETDDDEEPAAEAPGRDTADAAAEDDGLEPDADWEEDEAVGEDGVTWLFPADCSPLGEETVGTDEAAGLEVEEVFGVDDV